jgi:hypothetical protein
LIIVSSENNLFPPRTVRYLSTIESGLWPHSSLREGKSEDVKKARSVSCSTMHKNIQP